MAVLAMLELDGDTRALLAASDELARLIGRPKGVLARIVAPTDSGIVVFQLWESAEARRRHHEDPNHQAALEASGMTALVRGSRSRAYDGARLET